MKLKIVNVKYRLLAIVLLFVCFVEKSFSQEESQLMLTSGLSIIDDNFTSITIQ